MARFEVKTQKADQALPEYHTLGWDMVCDEDEPELFEAMLDWFKLPHIQDVEDLYEDGVHYGTRLIVGYWATDKENQAVLHAWQRHIMNAVSKIPDWYADVNKPGKPDILKNSPFGSAKCPECEAEKQSSPDMVNHPPHYQGKGPKGMECIEWIEEALTPEEFRGYLKGSALKYFWRYADKQKPIQDLDKMGWYRELLEEKVAENLRKDLP